jgi:hypothetical protein
MIFWNRLFIGCNRTLISWICIHFEIIFCSEACSSSNKNCTDIDEWRKITFFRLFHNCDLSVWHWGLFISIQCMF